MAEETQKTDSPAAEAGRLHLVLVTHDRKLLDVPADYVEVPGRRGTLGLLPGHTPLIAALKVGEVMYRQGKREHYLAIGAGFVEVAEDKATVLTEQAALPEEIDLAAAQRDLTEAEAALQVAADADWQLARARLEEAVVRVQVAQRVG